MKMLADLGYPRGAIIFFKNYENCMKIKEYGPRRGADQSEKTMVYCDFEINKSSPIRILFTNNLKLSTKERSLCDGTA